MVKYFVAAILGVISTSGAPAEPSWTKEESVNTMIAAVLEFRCHTVAPGSTKEFIIHEDNTLTSGQVAALLDVAKSTAMSYDSGLVADVCKK